MTSGKRRGDHGGVGLGGEVQEEEVLVVVVVRWRRAWWPQHGSFHSRRAPPRWSLQVLMHPGK